MNIYHKKKGMSPGSLIFTGEKKTENVSISLFDYNSGNFSETKVDDLNELEKYRNNSNVTWINVVGLHDINILDKIGIIFNIHPLVLEDILNVSHNPKIEEYDSYLFIVVKMINYIDNSNKLDIEQVSLIIGKNYIITFQEKNGDVFDPIRERIRTAKGMIRKYSEDYLAYRILDSIIDNYFSVLECFDDRIEDIEDQILTDPDESSLEEIHHLRKELIKLRRAVSPLREMIFTIEKEKFNLIQKTTFVYLRDLSDHVKQIIDTIENYREFINGLLEVYLSNASHRMNEVVKLLTIISTIFIPLTFIVGIYGMNFRTDASRWNMPELDWAFGYPFVMIMMVVIAVTLIIFFKKKRWF
ncbi:MAG: magnesium/cobalt transporter CorA [Ignavibacteriaceae bacterium]